MNAEVDRGWDFLAPYLRDAAAYVFSRREYIPRQLDASRATIIPPSIDPFSTKNQPIEERMVRAILACAGLIERADGCSAPLFVREDATPGRVDRSAVVVREGGPPSWDAPLVVQVSRWDRLKDPIGVMHGFARLPAILGAAMGATQLVLAGPSLDGVADDPEGAAVHREVVEAWRALPAAVRARVHLASLPTADVDENGAIVNALQRHAAVVVQKSLHEGFGLTVTEAMWKARPVIASAVGGIRDQIDDGVHGLLLADPSDLDAFAASLARLCADPAYGRNLGEHARARVFERYLGVDSLLRYGALIERLQAPRAEPGLPTAHA
jgi:trehalose synthase